MASVITKVIYMVVSLFSLGLLYYLFVPIFQVHFIPTLTTIANQSLSPSEATMVIGNIQTTYNIVMLVPFICVGALILFIGISSIVATEQDSTF